MGRAIPVVLGTTTFKSRTAARVFFQRMLHSYSNGERVRKADAALLTELLRLHPDAAVKIGSGIDHFEVNEADFASQCFYVYRTDGTHEDFSLHACIDV